MRSIRFLAAALLLGLATACTTPLGPVPAPGLTSPYYGRLDRTPECSGLGCNAYALGSTMSTCSLFGGPIKVTLTSTDDPYGQDGIVVAASAIETDGLYGEPTGQIGSGVFAGVGDTLISPSIPAGTCFLVSVKAGPADCFERNGLVCVRSGATGANYRVEW
jgi:hypothetical protein